MTTGTLRRRRSGSGGEDLWRRRRALRQEPRAHSCAARCPQRWHQQACRRSAQRGSLEYSGFSPARSAGAPV